jgi:hypothetical protein
LDNLADRKEKSSKGLDKNAKVGKKWLVRGNCVIGGCMQLSERTRGRTLFWTTCHLRNKKISRAIREFNEFPD